MSSTNKKRDAERRRKIEEAAKAKAEREAVPLTKEEYEALEAKRIEEEKEAERVAKEKLREEQRAARAIERENRIPKTAIGKALKEHRQRNEALVKSDPRFYKHRTLKALAGIFGATIFVLISGAGIYYLMSGLQQRSEQSWENTGQIAATVDGINIMEDSITSYIMDSKIYYGDGSDAQWARYLVDSNQTAEQIRQMYIDDMVDSIVQEKAYADQGITVDANDREDHWNELAEDRGGEDKLTEEVEGYGYTVDQYKQLFDSTIRLQKLKDKVAPKSEVTDQEIVDYVNDNAERYNGSRKSSHILFALDEGESTTNRDLAENVLKKIQDGELAFEDAVKEYSTDTGSAADGGNVGWTHETSFVEPYQQAVEALSDGEMSGIVESEYGYHIILCTGAIDFPEGGIASVDQLPEEVVDAIRESQENEQQNSDYQAWFDEFKSTLEIVVNDMPKGLPYDVDLALAETIEEEDTTAVAEGTVDGEDAVIELGGEEGSTDGSDENDDGESAA